MSVLKSEEPPKVVSVARDKKKSNDKPRTPKSIGQMVVGSIVMIGYMVITATFIGLLITMVVDAIKWWILGPY